MFCTRKASGAPAPLFGTSNSRTKYGRFKRIKTWGDGWWAKSVERDPIGRWRDLQDDEIWLQDDGKRFGFSGRRGLNGLARDRWGGFLDTPLPSTPVKRSDLIRSDL